MNRILITGAQGFIGRYVADAILRDHPDASVLGVGRSRRDDRAFTHEVTWGAHRIPAPTPSALRSRLAGPRYAYAQADLRAPAEVASVLSSFRPDVVIHLAGALRDAELDALLSANVRAVGVLLEGAVAADLHDTRFVLGSTGSQYGHEAPIPTPEHTRRSPPTPYALTKMAGEQLADLLAAQHGLHVCHARIFNPLGPGQDERHFFGAVCRQLAAIVAGRQRPRIEVGPLDATRDFIDVRDAADAIVALARSGRPGHAYNVGSGVERSMLDAFESAVRAADVGAALQVTHRPGIPVGVMRNIADVTKLRGLGAVEQVPFQTSIADILAYYRDVVAPASDASTHDALRPVGGSHVAEVVRRHRYAVTVHPGLLGELPERLATGWPDTRMVVLTDPRVRAMFGDALVDGLRSRGVIAELIEMDEGETSKSMASFHGLLARLRDTGFDRRALLINLGGGVVCDTGGFVASAYLRGVAYVNVPTTLLAQHDAAIGGKVAVNMPWAKNFVGAFHFPEAVFCDTSVLDSLDHRDLMAGVAEAIKLAVCGEPELFDLLETRASAIRSRHPQVLAELVSRSIAHKVAMLAPDPLEVDLRRVLNFGHTLAHPLETAFAYQHIRHGEAVGYGIALETLVAVQAGRCSREDGDRILDLLDAYDLPPPLPRDRVEGCLAHLDAVRLVRGGFLHVVLPTSHTSVQIVDDVTDDAFERAIDAFAARAPSTNRQTVSW